MRIKLFLIVFCFFTFPVLWSQTTLNITDASMGNPGSADVIFAQAQNLANSGQNVTIEMNAPGLCVMTNALGVNLTNGSITIQKDPTATVTQGFMYNTFNPGGYGLQFFCTNPAVNVTVKNISVQNMEYALVMYGGNNFTCDNIKALACNLGVWVADYLNETKNTLIQNCEFDKTGVTSALESAIVRENSINSSTAKTFKVLNNNFKSGGMSVYIATQAATDALNIDVQNNFSSQGLWTARFGAYYYFVATPSYAHVSNDYLFDVDFSNNTDVRAVVLNDPLNYWKVDNNVFHVTTGGGANISMGPQYPNNVTPSQYRNHKTSFIKSGTPHCTNQTFLNGNNTFNKHASYPVSTGGYQGMTIGGNNALGCAVTEVTDLDLAGSVSIGGNVSVRRCKIFSSLNIDLPILSISPANAKICATSLTTLASGQSLNVSYLFIGIPPSKGNDLYVDFYKSNANGDLLEYIGQEVHLNSSLPHSSNLTLPVPSSVTLSSSDRIAMTITGLAATPNFSAVGTSKAFYSPPINCVQSGFISATPSPAISLGISCQTANQLCQPLPIGPPQPEHFWTAGCWLNQCGNVQCFHSATICENQSFQLNAAPPNVAGVTYSWDFGDGSPIVNGNSATHMYTSSGNYVITVVATGPNCQPLTETINVTVIDCSCKNASISGLPASGCINTPINMNIAGCANPQATYNWSFGDGVTATGIPVSHSYSNPGNYNVICTITLPGYPTQVVTAAVIINVCTQVSPCLDCIGTFQPDAGDYMVSLWVREDVSPQPQTYNNPKIEISFNGSSALYTFGTNSAKNKIIEGWQRIEESFNIPATATDIHIKLVNSSSSIDSYYDDIRIFPKDGQMKTYVYDPITLRLTSTLDENNYATFYEYDEEGKLIRVKKETEKGIMTIQESREAVKKK